MIDWFRLFNATFNNISVISWQLVAISSYHHSSCEFKPRSWWGVLNTTLCDKFCQWFSPDTLVSSTNKTNCHDITEILLKVALNTINHRAFLQFFPQKKEVCVVLGLSSRWKTKWFKIALYFLSTTYYCRLIIKKRSCSMHIYSIIFYVL
jgi:hypothetical protein